MKKELKNMLPDAIRIVVLLLVVFFPGDLTSATKITGYCLEIILTDTGSGPYSIQLPKYVGWTEKIPISLLIHRGLRGWDRAGNPTEIKCTLLPPPGEAPEEARQ